MAGPTCKIQRLQYHSHEFLVLPSKLTVSEGSPYITVPNPHRRACADGFCTKTASEAVVMHVAEAPPLTVLNGQFLPIEPIRQKLSVEASCGQALLSVEFGWPEKIVRL